MKKCIIVDDVALNIVLAQKMLTSLNLDMSKAVNGQQACDMIRNGYEPDIMILDLMMPIMDGFQVLEENETAGFGKRCFEDEYVSQINALTSSDTAPLLSGATLTSTAIQKGFDAAKTLFDAR